MDDADRGGPREPEMIDVDALDFGQGAKRVAGERPAKAPEPELIDADSLDFGLGVAFAKGGRRAGESVAAAIQRMTGGAPRPLLPDDSDEPAPVLRVLPGGGDRLGDDGRYEALGEIARGGLGIVLKGRDRDLGRDVAIKVLRPEFAKNDAVLARFVEEAQIGGQLQHPGLVPVYSMGIESDGRPFFAMKLVKGRTLASLLVDRKSPREGLRRHLATFESVCKTMAYAHSRRVVHRDLKPSNVMLGAFGEVQVVDWGLAKVLGREDVPGVRPAESAAEVSLIATVRSGSAGSGSIAGSVLGTPGYLSPEQALGRIEDVDERTDVFALGSILCEILTGEPPFTGDARDQILLAARGNLDDANARLAKCGADPAVVAIATKCLASDRDERWRDAGALADAVTAHLSGAEARARQAEIAAAQARAKAEEERTHAARERSAAARERAAQRRTIAVSAVALAVVAVAIVVGRSHAADESDRATRAVAAVSAALADANVQRGGRNLVPAVAAAQKAVALAKTGEVDAETADRAAKVLAEIEAEEQAARAATAQAAKDEAFAAAMARAHEISTDEAGYARMTADCFAAFREYGVDLEKCDVETGAALLRASPRLGDMTAVLDSWTWESRAWQAQRPIPPEADAVIARVEQIVRAADPDPWRSRLRETMKTGTGDGSVIRSLAVAPEVETQPDRTLDWLTWGLKRDGDTDAVLKLGRVQARRHPGRPWLGVGSIMSGQLDAKRADRLDPDERSAAWTARLAIHPSVDRWQDLGRALEESNEPIAAIAAFDEAVRLDPDSYQACEDLMEALHRGLGEFDDRLKQVADRAEKLDPKRAASYFFRGKILDRSGDFAAAEANFRKAIALVPESDRKRIASAHLGLASVLMVNRNDEATAEARIAVRFDPSPENVGLLLGQAEAPGSDVDAFVEEGKRALERFPGDVAVLRGYQFAISAAARKAEASNDMAKALAFADEAVEMSRKAVASAPRDAYAHRRLAGALAARAKIVGTFSPEAIDEYREAIRLEQHPTWFGAHQTHEFLAGELLRAGRFDEAGAEFARALRIEPHCPELNSNYGQLLFDTQDDRAEAIRLLRNSVALAPDNLWMHYQLVVAMLRNQTEPAGARVTAQDFDVACKGAAEALARYRKKKDSADGAAKSLSFDRIIACLIDPQFPDTVRRGVKPADRADAADLQIACVTRRLYAAGTRLAIDGLSAARRPGATPVADEDCRWNLHFNGACCAVHAAIGDGEDAETLDAATRSQLHRQAIDWLRAALVLGGSGTAGADRFEPQTPANNLAHSLVDPDLACVREPDSLAKLPPDDRAAWERFWAEVERAVRAFAQGRK